MASLGSDSAVRKAPFAFTVTDPRLPDNPITYVNEGFEKLTLYSRAFAIGRNARFLQCEDTDAQAVEEIRRGMAEQREVSVTLLNRRCDGSTFHNQMVIAPIFGRDGEVTAFFGIQRVLEEAETSASPAPLDMLRELQHRVKNHLGMIAGMIRLQSRREVTRESLVSLGHRIEALALLYDELFRAATRGSGGDEMAAGAYLSRVVHAVAGIEGRSSVRVNVECDEIALTIEQAARLGLLLSEILTNALQHAFEGRDAGCVTIAFTRQSGSGVRLRVEDDGVGMPQGSEWPRDAASVREQQRRAKEAEGALDTTGGKGNAGVGGSIVRALCQSLGAQLSVESVGAGTTVTIDITADRTGETG